MKEKITWKKTDEKSFDGEKLDMHHLDEQGIWESVRPKLKDHLNDVIITKRPTNE